MFQISEQEIDRLIHDLLGLIKILKVLGDDKMTLGQRQILTGCETNFLEIRQHLLEHIREVNNNKKEN